MKSKFIRFTSLFSALLLLSTYSCKKDKKIITQGPVFSLEKFDSELRASLIPSGGIGWGYVISQNGIFAKGEGFGKSRNTADGDRKFTLNRKVNIASVSKLMTTVAVMQLLERRGLTVNSPINQWLPATWSKGPGVNTLTFANLLGHTSGLSSANTAFTRTLNYTGLRLCIDTGVVRSQTYTYLNVNFALFRVLIPSLWRGLDGAPNISANLDSASTTDAYMQYMQENVFEPIGLNNITCEPEERSIATMYYATGDLDNTNGIPYNSWTSMAGGGGFYMTTIELAQFMAYLKHTELLVTKEQRKIMEDNRFGMDREDEGREIRGKYFGKNGSIRQGGKGTMEQVVYFPNGIEVVVMFNTQGMIFAGGETSLQNAIYDAYNKAWE